MKTLITGFSLAAISAVVTTTAFAESGQGIGRAGTYQAETLTQTSTNEAPKSRAQVRAELAAAYSNGSLPALNRNSYPSLCAATASPHMLREGYELRFNAGNEPFEYAAASSART